MKKSELKNMDAASLAEFLCSTSNANEVAEVLNGMDLEDVYDLCTSILPNGHTVVHLLAQRKKLQSLRLVLQHGVDVHARNAQGATPLHVALQHNALYSAKVLIDHGAQVSEVTSRRKGLTLLHRMVACDRPHAVLLLLGEGANVNAVDSEGRTPLHLAAIYGNCVAAAILIRNQHCLVNAVDTQGHTALMLAIINNNQELARQLVDAPKVDVTLRDKRGMSSLHLAVSLAQLEVVRTLLRRNTANINGKERHMGRTPIHLACALTCNNEGLVSSICVAADRQPVSVSHDSDKENGNLGSVQTQVMVNGTSSQVHPGYTSSALGILKASSSALSSETEGLSTQPASYEDGNAQYTAQINDEHSEESSGGTVHGISDDGVLPNTQVSKSSGPKRSSIMKSPRNDMPRHSKHTVTIKMAQRSKSLHNSKTAGGLTSMSESKAQTRHSIAGDLLVHSSRDTGHKYTCTSISSPRRAGRPSTAPSFSSPHNSLMSASVSQHRLTGARPDSARDSVASNTSRPSLALTVTPFNMAMVRCRIVSLLLDHGADANLMTAFRKSPLHITAILGAADVMGALLPHVTNVNVLSVSNKTALHLAVEGQYSSVATQLLYAGANVALRDISGMTALHIAAILGNIHLVRLLLKFKADKNSCDFQQKMPLHHAYLHDRKNVINILLKAGARADTMDTSGHRPQDYEKLHAPSIASPLGTRTNSSSEQHVTRTSSDQEHTPGREDSKLRVCKSGLFKNLGNSNSRAAEDFQRPQVLFDHRVH